MSIDSERAIVGFGPAGLAAVLESDKEVVAFDAGEYIGGGNLWGLTIDSNSTGTDFAEPFDERFWDLAEAHELAGNPDAVPLSNVARFLGETAARLVSDRPDLHIPRNVTAIHIDDRRFELATGSEIHTTKEVVLATGAREVLLPELSAGRDASNTFTSGEVLHPDRQGELKRVLDVTGELVVIGNAHSAYSVAGVALDLSPDARVTFIKRSDTLPYFKSVNEAVAYGYELTDRDIPCPETGKINRFNGIRGKARELWLEEQVSDERLRSVKNFPLQELPGDIPVVQAVGYRPRLPDIYDKNSELVDCSLVATASGLARVFARGQSLTSVSGIGLGYSVQDGVNVYFQQAKHIGKGE